MQDVGRRHRAQSPDVFDADVGPPILRQHVHDRFGPVRPVPQKPQVAQRLLRAAQLPLALAELVAERDQELAEAFALVLR